MAALVPALKAAAPALIASGGSAVAGALGNRASARTSSQTTSTALSPEQQKLSTALATRLGQRLENPSHRRDGIQALKNQAKTNLNRSTRAAGSNLEQGLAARGFERSGVAERGATQLEAARIDGLSSIESSILQYLDEAERGDENDTINAILRFLPENRTTNSTGVGPAQNNALGQGLETFATLQMLQQLLGGGAAPRPGASPASSLDL